MVGAISGSYGSYGAYARWGASIAAMGGSASVRGAQGAQGVAALSVRRAAQPETPVEPVRPVTTVKPGASGDINRGALLQRMANDPAEMAVRMRIQYARPGEEAAQQPKLPGAAGEDEPELKLPGAKDGEAQGPRLLGADKPEDAKPWEMKLPGADDGEAVGAEAVQKAAEEGKCETCAKRKYQDGSDDAGVSFKTPTRLSPDRAASAVRGHEQEHVVREQAKAEREDREVVSQKVTLHTDICPECGRVYVSGGVTETVTAAKPQQPEVEKPEDKSGFGAVA